MIRNKDPSFGFYLRGDASHPLSKKGLSVWEYIRRGEPAEKAGTLVCCRRDSGSRSCSEKKAFDREKKGRRREKHRQKRYGGVEHMYRKRAGGWLKHLDFIMLDGLCLQAAFMLAYAVRMGPSSPYGDEEYRGIGIVLLLAVVAVALLSGTFSGVLKRGYYEEFMVTLRHACLVEVIAVLYLFTAQKHVGGSRFVIYLTGILYITTGYFSRLLWKKLLLKRKAAEGERRSLLVVTESWMVGEVLEDLRSQGTELFNITGTALLDRERRQGKSPDSFFMERKVGNADRIWPGDGKTADGTEEKEKTPDIPVVAGAEDIIEAVCRSWVDEALIVLPRSVPYPEELVEQLAGMGVVVHVSVFRAGTDGGMRQFVGHLGEDR